VLTKTRNLVSGALGVAGGVTSYAVRTVTGRPDPEVEAAQKAARTRERKAEARSDAAKQAAETRREQAAARRRSAQKAARTRRQRDERVDAMVEAMEGDPVESLKG
jgi:hypothetical protein